MLRQSLIYLLMSILVVIFAKYAHLLVVYVDMFIKFCTRLLPIAKDENIFLSPEPDSSILSYAFRRGQGLTRSDFNLPREAPCTTRYVLRVGR